MKISHLLFLGCIFYVFVYDVRGSVNNIMQEFEDEFKKYVNQNSSNLNCFNILKNLNRMCSCAIEQLQKIHDGFQNQNSTEELLKTNLKALIELMKSGKAKDETKQPGSRDECKYLCWNPKSTVGKIKTFFRNLKTRTC